MTQPTPATVMLNDGREMALRELAKADAGLVDDFAAGLNGQAAGFLAQDLTTQEGRASWLEGMGAEDYHVLGALDPELGGRLAGYCRLRTGLGAHAHTGEIEVFIHPDYAGLGLGSGLLRETAHRAKGQGLLLLRAEIPVDNKDKLVALKTLGFELKAIVEDFRIDTAGQPYDVIIRILAMASPRISLVWKMWALYA